MAPILAENKYKALIQDYERNGKIPRRLKVGGMIIDSSVNLNQWMVPKEELENIATQLVGKSIRKDHSDSVDSVIGKVEEAWVEDDKVFYTGEVADEHIIPKILLGYVHNNSIQLAADSVYCARCLEDNKMNYGEARINNIEEPCPRCGTSQLVVKPESVIELSFVATPAYETGEFEPFGFYAAVDKKLKKRFTKENRDLDEILLCLSATLSSIATLYTTSYATYLFRRHSIT